MENKMSKQAIVEVSSPQLEENGQSSKPSSSSQQSSTTPLRNTLTVVDNRTGKTFEVPIEDGYFVNSTHFKKMLTDSEDKNGIM